MDLSILIVTYNSAALIGALLENLLSQIQNLSAEVIVVDNASRDLTVEIIRRDFPWVKLIASQQNLGFAAGNNLAARQASGRTLLLLNPDAMVHTGALERGLKLMAEHPKAGLAGGELRGADGSRQPSARMFPTLRDELFTLTGLAARYPNNRWLARLDRRWADPEAAAQVDWIPGALVFIPAHLFEQLHGFDERFFMYYEEVDLCRRIQAAGYHVHYWPELKATHIGGASAKTVKQARISRSGSQLEGWRMRSALLYYRKHHQWLGAIGLFALEWGWHKLREYKAKAQSQHEKAADFGVHCQQLRQAWKDTAAGSFSPQKPW